MHAHLRRRCLVTLKLNGNPSEKENCGKRNYFAFQLLWALSVDQVASAMDPHKHFGGVKKK